MSSSTDGSRQASCARKIDEHAPRLQETEDRASVTGAIAADARTEAERTAEEAERKATEARELEELAQQKAAEARRLEEHAQKHAEEARRRSPPWSSSSERPTVSTPTCAPMPRATGSTSRGRGCPTGSRPALQRRSQPRAACAAAASAPFLRDDDEPDLADAENPFATPEADAADTSTDSASDDRAMGTKKG